MENDSYFYLIDGKDFMIVRKYQIDLILYDIKSK